MDFGRYIELLAERLKKELPGSRSHSRMTSDARMRQQQMHYKTAEAKKGAVLIFLYPMKGSVYTVLIKRQHDGGVHSGQISFPGGKMEEQDQNGYETALREAHEEVNIHPGSVHVAGHLTELYIPPSNFLVLPVVAYSERKPGLKPEPMEVAAIMQVDLLRLKREFPVKKRIIKVRGDAINAPYFDIEGETVWGATAMIMSEMLDVMP